MEYRLWRLNLITNCDCWTFNRTLLVSGQWLVASYSAYGEATSGAKSSYELCLPVAAEAVPFH